MTVTFGITQIVGVSLVRIRFYPETWFRVDLLQAWGRCHTDEMWPEVVGDACILGFQL